MENKETDTTVKVNAIKSRLKEKKANRRSLGESIKKISVEIIKLENEIEALVRKNFVENCDLIANSYIKYIYSDSNYTWQWFVKLFDVMDDDEIEYGEVKFKAKYVHLVYKNEDDSLVCVSYDSDGEIIMSDEYEQPSPVYFSFAEIIHSNEQEFDDSMTIMKEFLNKETNI